MKYVNIDTNIQNDFGNFFIHELDAKKLELYNGEKIVVYQDDEEWDAIVQYDNGWCVKIISEARPSINEVVNCRNNAFMQGQCMMLRLICLLEENKATNEKISQLIENYF